MDALYATIGVFSLPLNQIGPMLAHMPIGLAIIIAAIPITAAIISRNYGELCGIIALLGVAIAVVLEPTAAPGITAVATYFVCLVLGFESIRKWRSAHSENSELAELRDELISMRDAEDRRQKMELDLKYPLREMLDSAPPITPRQEMNLGH